MYLNKFKFLVFILIILINPVGLFSQDTDFLSLLNDSSGSATFLLSQKPDRYLPFTDKEENHLKRFQSASLKSNDAQSIIAANNLGMISLKKGDPARAITWFNKSLEAGQRMLNNKAIATALIELGMAYQQSKNYSSSLNYYITALPVIEQMKLPKVTGLVYFLSGQCYVKTQDFPRAIELFTRASKSFTQGGEIVQTASCFNSLGEIYLRQDDYKIAREKFNYAIELLKNSKDKNLKALVLRNLGLVEFKQGQFEKAIDFFYSSIAVNDQLILHKLVKDAYMQLFNYYSFKNDFAKADAYHQRYRDIKDSINFAEQKSNSEKLIAEDEKQNIILLLQKQYQDKTQQLNQRQLELSQMFTRSDIEIQNKNQLLEQKDSVVQQLTSEKFKRERDLAQKELQLSQQKNFRNLLLAISIGAFLLALILYFSYKMKKNSHLRLEKSHKELAETLDQLKKTQDQLVQSEKMASLGQLTAGIAHEIQNPLNFVNNFSESTREMLEEFMETNDERGKEELAGEIKNALNKIHFHGKRADQIVRNMLLHSRSGVTEKEPADMNRIVLEMVDLAYHGIRANIPDYQCKIDHGLRNNLPEVIVNRQEIGRVLLNIFSNSFYAMNKKRVASGYNGYDPELQVSTLSYDSSLVIKVRDNGTGIPKNIRGKIFEPFFTTKPAGEGTGLGLSLSYDIISKGHGGQIEVDSEEGSYTEFNISIPMNN